MNDEKLDRRQFFERAAVIGAVATGAGSFLAACKKKGGGQAEKGGSRAGAAQAKAGGLDCTDTSGLKAGQLKTRKSLEYTDNSSKPNEKCAKCQLFKKPSKNGACGGCQVVPGPINPQGWCKQFVAKA